jgi:hypothetical protein
VEGSGTAVLFEENQIDLHLGSPFKQRVILRYTILLYLSIIAIGNQKQEKYISDTEIV